MPCRAMRDPEVARRWAEKHLNANIGCLRAEDICVVDLDVRGGSFKPRHVTTPILVAQGASACEHPLSDPGRAADGLYAYWRMTA